MMTNLATNIMMILISGICIVASRSQILKPVCMALANGAWPGICIGNVVLRIINQAVWPPGGISGVVPAPLKMMSIFFSCQLCQYSGIVKASAQAVVGDTVVVVDGITGEKTKLDEVFTSSFDPYRSINFAQECKCFPAIEYNLEKERQIQCIYKNCIKESAKLGLPFGHCDSTLRQQQCLYVDSAAWKLTGSKFMGAFIAISEAVMATMMAASALWSFLACGPVSVAQLGGASTMPAYNPALCTGFLFVEAPEFRLTEGLLNLASVALTPAFGAAMAFTNCMTDSELMDNSGCITACGTSGATLQLYEAAALQQNPFDWGGMTSNIKGNDYCRE
jgi:hypothetical protein